MSDELIQSGKAVSDLSSVKQLNVGDLLLVSVVSADLNGNKTFQSKNITKENLFNQLTSELGHYETWIFSYEDINGQKTSLNKQVFIQNTY